MMMQSTQQVVANKQDIEQIKQKAPETAKPKSESSIVTESGGPPAEQSKATPSSQEQMTAEEVAEQERKVKMWNDSQTLPEMGIFDRQLRIQNWNQKKVEESVCLLLGVGGLGTGVALGLARLGVKKIILLDKDTVDLTNLNRQVLFKLSDVGLDKATTAKERLLENHIVTDKTEVVAYQMCALQNFGKVVELVEESTVVFNMIDVGEFWDIAVQSVCMKKKRLLISGGTFCQQLSVDIFRPSESCYLCSAFVNDKEMIAKLMPNKIEAITNLEFIPRDRNPIAQSNVYVCQMCAQMMVCRFSSLLIADPEVEIMQRFIMTVNAGEVVQFPVEQEPKCPFCLEIGTIKPQVDEAPKKVTEEEKDSQSTPPTMLALGAFAVAGLALLMLKKQR